ncbi:uncharacterized protein C8Q71DRAFT_222574 [Rhodofomes roseus]|uniref:Ribosome biogenesis protein NSA1 n=1 Tax=Rhodofomes roseus TaxID=34475 RepID=A0ABQ8KUX3_9APHY|nr:uncharacterized protein C8Q71DRAFT_222574 [Rhodofomes roseus]KAH9842823.1 hypothetical protein C8Q71DRAFT_222574 [Rhodofomes roseus]
MPRFFTGDELGSVKSVRYLQDSVEKQWKPEVHIISSTPAEARPVPVQKLAFSVVGTDKVLAAARGDGSASIYRIQEDESVSSVAEWKEARLKPGQRYVGLSVSEKRVFSCTSNGALRATTLGEGDSAPSAQTSVLPMRLCEWRLSHDAQTFAYGGDEVELSVWDTERAFAPRDNIPADAESKKRKRGGELLPGEVWRAKNVPNDGLSLRQPVHNTSLTYLQPSSSASSHHLLVGTHHGHVRRYDTRAARRPVADWKGIGKVGGVRMVENGLAEHEVFVSDNGSNLFALDLRNGRVIYGYKSIAGAVSSVAHSPSVLASVAQDRFLRLHSTFPPPKEPGQQQEHKGEVLDKLYMKAVPTVVVWDQSADASQAVQGAEEAGEEADDDDDVWDAMEDVEDEETEGRRSGKKKSRTAE